MINISNIANEIQAGFFDTEPRVPQNIIEKAGRYDGKYANNVSLASHIINTVLVGVNCYAYDKFIQGEEDVNEEELRVLLAALSLHDVNKYVNEKYGWDKEVNDAETLEKYFEEDDFQIREFLGGDYFDDLLYLIQRTEVKEDSRETRGTETEFRRLDRYCRIGDAAASKILNEGVRSGKEYLERKYSSLDGDHVHLLEFTAVEQPILNDLTISSVKSYISGEDGSEPVGVVLGSTSDAVLYLGVDIDEGDLKRRTEEVLSRMIPDRFEFSCKVGWNSFDYDILSEISLPSIQFVDKKEIIADEFVSLLERGAAGVEAFENVPNEFQKYLPILAKALYVDSRNEYNNAEVQSKYDELYEWDNQKVKIHFIAYLLETYPKYEEFLHSLEKDIEPKLKEDLEPDTDSDVIETVVSRFFGDDANVEVSGKDSMCFLCGRKADIEYQKGHEAFYATQSYSRRVGPNKKRKYKKICGVCNLEYTLLTDLCRKNDINLRNDVEVAYFYYDDFIGDVRLYDERASPIIQGDTTVMDRPNASIELLSPQYHLQPFYVTNENHRMNIVRECLETLRKSGMKVVIGKPFSRFQTSSYIFEDEEAIRPEQTLGLDKIRRYEELERPLKLFNAMWGMRRRNASNPTPYIDLDRDEFHTIANKMVVNANRTNVEEVVKYLETYHGDDLMEMKQVAQNGLNLFGKQFNSKYKKTKVFRECLDSFLSGMSQGMSDEVLLEHVAGQVYDSAKREEYAGHVDYDQTLEFVESVKEYLVENDMYDLKRMSDWENALVNSYYFAYDQLLYGDNNEN